MLVFVVTMGVCLMLSDVVRISSARKENKVVLTGNKPIGWCRGDTNNEIDSVGSSNINIYGTSKRYALLYFDIDTFPPIDEISVAVLNVRAYALNDEHDKIMRTYRFLYSNLLWDNITGPSFFNRGYVGSNPYGGLLYNSTGYSWDSSDITAHIRLMLTNNQNAMVLQASNVENSDFNIDFNNGNEPYIDFTLR